MVNPLVLRTGTRQLRTSGQEDPDTDPDPRPHASRGRRWTWLAGLVGAVLVLGPALGPGSILHLDFVLLPDLHVPRGVWGLGPELPRRVPLMVPFAWLSPLIGGEIGIKLLLVASLTAGFAGACRLAEGVALPWRLGAGVLYAFSPFTLTRVGVGHVFVVAAMAVLPWAAPTLSRPTSSLRRTVVWSAALGFCGVYGGVLAGALVAAGLIDTAARRRTSLRRGAGAIAALVVGQLPWLVPGLVVATQTSTSLAGATPFATDVAGIDGPLRVLAGHGFWASDYQVGGTEGPWIGVIGLGLAALAIAGTSRLPAGWRRPVTGTAIVAASVVVLAGLGFTDEIAADVIGAALPAVRESQRLLALYLLWLAPAAALGADRLARRLDAPGEVAASSSAPAPDRRAGALGGLVLALPLTLGLVLSSTGVWGIGGTLEPVDLPAEWAEVRHHIDAEPGTVLALPWAQYLDLLVAGGDRVLQPLPLYLGGDVLGSSDLAVGEGNRERGDPREPVARALAIDLLEGTDIAPDLARLGVRWVVLLHETDREWELYQVALQDDTTLESVVSGLTISLFEVPGWRGPVLTSSGEDVELDPVLTPYQRLDPSAAATWAHPAAAGWLRGSAATGTSHLGLLTLPEGSGPVWYWPALVCVLADLVTLSTVVWCLWSRRGRDRGGLSHRQVIAG